MARAPGRVNLLGDHTDTTGGLVLPLAVDRWTEIHGTRTENRVRLRSQPLEGEVEFSLDDMRLPDHAPTWGRYVLAVARELASLAPLSGVDGIVRSTVPVGAGLSSSAALEVAVALALTPTTTWDPATLAAACRRAEHHASGVPCGIMDQFISLVGRDGCAVLIDCEELTHEPVALPEGVEVAVKFVAHRSLAGSEYAARTASLDAVQAVVGPLRLLSPDDLGRLELLKDPVLIRRARHVITENARVRAGVEALRAGDARAFGAVMSASHTSLRDDFEVSTPAMDTAVDRWQRTPGVWGARLTGGGFGGCITALTTPGALTHDPDAWIVRAVGGAST